MSVQIVGISIKNKLQAQPHPKLSIERIPSLNSSRIVDTYYHPTPVSRSGMHLRPPLGLWVTCLAQVRSSNSQREKCQTWAKSLKIPHSVSHLQSIWINEIFKRSKGFLKGRTSKDREEMLYRSRCLGGRRQSSGLYLAIVVCVIKYFYGRFDLDGTSARPPHNIEEGSNNSERPWNRSTKGDKYLSVTLSNIHSSVPRVVDIFNEMWKIW